MGRFKTKKRGFSLVELMVSLSVLIIVTLAIMTTIGEFIKLNRQKTEISVANQLVEAQLEKYLKTPANIPVSGTPLTFTPSQIDSAISLTSPDFKVREYAKNIIIIADRTDTSQDTTTYSIPIPSAKKVRVTAYRLNGTLPKRILTQVSAIFN